MKNSIILLLEVCTVMTLTGFEINSNNCSDTGIGLSSNIFHTDESISEQGSDVSTTAFKQICFYGEHYSD